MCLSFQFERHPKSHWHNPGAQYRTRKQAPEAKSPPPHTGQVLEAVPGVSSAAGFKIFLTESSLQSTQELEMTWKNVTGRAVKTVYSDLT